MAKITLNTIGSRYGSIDALNDNFAAIEEAFENTVSRDGTGPNYLEADIDANSHRIINLPTPIYASEAANKGYVDGITSILQQYLDEVQIVSDNISSVNAVAGVATTISENETAIVNVGDNIDDVTTVANNIGSVNLVGLDLNGAFEEGVIYDFGSITDAPVGPAPTTDSNIVIVAQNIADVNTVADNILIIQGVEAQAQAAATSAAAALASEQAATLSEANAAASEASSQLAESNAEAAQLAALTAQGLAEDAQVAAEAAETAASGYATTALGAKDDAVTAQLAAEAALASTLAAYDNFDDRYLGAKASDPATDNDGDPLVAGALYFLTGSGMKIWTGSSWEFAYVPGATYLAKTNNLSDLNNVATARTNLGLGTAATTNSTAYATAAQGSLADTALQTADAGALALLDTVGTTQIDNNAVTVDKLAATLDFGSIV